MTEIAVDVELEDEGLWERRFRFLTMRNGGGTFTAIAERYNRQQLETFGEQAKQVSPSTVRKDVERAKERIVGESTREAMIAECQSVILDVRRQFYGAMIGGDVDAAKIVLTTVVQQREMFGLDAPKHSTIGIGTDVQFAETLLGLINVVGEDVKRELGFVASDRNELIAPPGAIDGEVLDVESDSEVSVTGAAELVETDDLAWDDDVPWSNVAETSSVRPSAEVDDG